jgi:hypothetical protein
MSAIAGCDVLQGNVWTYGASMGGTAALMFAKCLRANGVISLSPQASIDLGTAAFDPRWISDRKAINGIDDSWLRDAVCAKTYCIYDPMFDLDRKHVNLIL